MYKANISGRLQQVEIAGKKVVFDVGHNPGAAAVLKSTLKKKFAEESVCFVIGIMKDKDIAGILAQYSEITSRIIFTRPDTDRAASPELLHERLGNAFNIECILIPEVADAVSAALSYPEHIICITGSFFTVGEAFRYLRLDGSV